MFGDNAEGEDFEQQEEIDENSVWKVIDAFFEEKGLVRQQLDSFNEFVSTTIQEIIDETPPIVVKPENQYNPGQNYTEGEEKEYRVKFGQIYLQKPNFREHDSDNTFLFPREARLRNLT
jgi:DNA-directed RNA polymerase II subunit RPB2